MSKFSLHNNNGSLIISEVIVITKTSFINVKNYMIMSLMALGQQKPSLRPLEKFFLGGPQIVKHLEKVKVKLSTTFCLPKVLHKTVLGGNYYELETY